jgi:hypothetical protein
MRGSPSTIVEVSKLSRATRRLENGVAAGALIWLWECSNTIPMVHAGIGELGKGNITFIRLDRSIAQIGCPAAIGNML